MNRFDERMLDRDLEETLGGDAPSDLRERILAAHAAPARRRTGRVRPLPVATGRRSNQTAIWGIAMVTLALAALFVVFWSYIATRPTTQTPDVAGGNTPKAPVVKQEPVPQPAPKAPDANVGPEEPKEQPEIIPKEPAPKEQPRTPEEPPKEQPKQPPKPDDEVKKPEPPKEEPKNPETEPKVTPQPERARLGSVLLVPKGAKLQVRFDDKEPWRDAANEALLAGMYMKVAHATDLTLGDALVRFEGEIRLDDANGAIRLDLLARKTQAWCDNLGGRTPLVLGVRDLSAELKDGAAHLYADSSTLDIACIEGEVVAGDNRLTSGHFAVLSAKGLSKPRELTLTEHQPRLIAGMAPRKLLREEFTEEPAGKLYGGKIVEGAAKAEGAGSMVAFDINPTVIAVKGAKLRMRYRVSGCDNIYLQFLGEDVSKQYGVQLVQRKQGQWVELELKLDSLDFDGNGDKGKLQQGLKLGKFQCYVRGEKNCTLEIDWLEVVRE